MNTENFNAWLHEMRTTDKEQGQHVLCRLDGTTKEFCCLGLGSEMVPDMCIEINERNEYGGSSRYSVYYGADQQATTAPREFIEWLGLTMDEGDSSGDVWVDLPDNLNDPDGDPLFATAAGMNDSGFTFKQIADVFAYFGPQQLARN